MFGITGLWSTSVTTRRALPLVLAVLLLAALCIADAPRVHADTLTVNNTSDFGGGTVDFNPGDGICETATGNGICTLRAAIQEANVPFGMSTINFSIGSGTATIDVFSELPDITSPVNINGISQPGYTDFPLIVLDGSSAGGASDGLTIMAGGSRVRGLAIQDFGGKGLRIQGAMSGDHIIQHNYVGATCTSCGVPGNVSDGIFVGGSGSNTIGGLIAPETGGQCGSNTVDEDDDGFVNDGCPAVGPPESGTECSDALDSADADPDVNDGCPATGGRNVISGNGESGIELGSSGNQVLGNLIGTSADGTLDVGNTFNGVRIGTSNNTIGPDNVISGNDQDGVDIGASGNFVRGNLIGTNAAGTASLANSLSGVEIGVNATGNTVGGTTAGDRNVISGNDQDGVFITSSNASGNFVQGNYIGTDVGGTADLGNADNGVDINSGAHDNTIGGTAGTTPGGLCTGACNLISGNTSSGVHIHNAATYGNNVQGNYIGTNVNGVAALGNSSHGVRIGGGADTNTVGGTTASARNVISGNTVNGVHIQGAGTMGNVLLGNYIGTNATSTAAIPNGARGVEIEAPSNTIGGTAAGAGNVISGNLDRGIAFEGAGTTGNVVQGNYIGVGAGGTPAMGNTFQGVWFGTDDGGQTIGGTTAGAGNLIASNGDHGIGILSPNNMIWGNTIRSNGVVGGEAGIQVEQSGNIIGSGTGNPFSGNTITANGGDGVYVVTGTGNRIRGNSIYANGGLGIDLGTDGVTPNDGFGDADTGANNLMNFPTDLTGAYDGVSTTISGTLETPSPDLATVHVYASDIADGSGNGEGRVHLGKTSPDVSGEWTLVFSGAPPYGKITATATDAGFNTSEFSEAYSLPVGPRLPATTISYQGQVTPIGGTFNTFGPAAVPSTSGNVVFWATINGLPLIPHGIFSSPAGGPITKLVAVGDATPLGGTFSSIGASPVNNELGKVAFWAAVSGGSASEGIFLWSPAGGGTITKIVASGESTPIGGTAYVSFQPPAGSPVAVLNNGGDISFWASVASCCGVYEGVFLYSAAGGTVSKVAATGDPTPAGGTFSTFLSPGFYATIPIVTDQQKVAFRGIISGGPASGVFLASGATLTTVAAAGGSTPLGGTYTSFGRAPSPNESGEVAFWATMSGSSAGICVNGVPCAAFLRNSGGTVSKIIAGGDSGPAGVGGTISDLASAPFMNDSGQVSVWAAVSGGFSSQALVRYTPGEALANVAAVGNSIPAPISSTFDTFVQGGFATSPIPNNLGQVAFWGHGSEGIFLTDPPPPGPVITQGPVQGATAPGTDGGEFGSMFDLDIDNNGEAVFANTVIGGDSGVTSGIFAFFAGTAVRDVALEGDSAPEGGQFDNFFPPYSNDNGTIVARAETVSPNGEGLYAFFAGSPDDAIAVPGDVIPGQGGGTIASSGFSDPSINNAGYVAARATLTGGQQGLYIFFAGSPFKVFKSGETAPGGGGNFSTFGRPALSDFNDVAVKATLSPPGQGLYAFFAGVPQKLARTNDTADANNRVFTDFSDPVLNIDQAVAFTATFTEGGGPSQKGLFAFFAGSPTAQLIADNDPVSPAPSVPPSGGGQFTGFFSPAMTDGTSPVVVARATITGGSASEGLFVFFAGSVVKLVGQGDLITDTSDPDDAFGLPAPVFPYHAINNGRKVVFVANVLNGATSQGVYFASLDYDNDGVLDFLDNCPSTFNTVQHDSDEDGPGNPCDNCPSAGNTSQQNSDADSFGNACDNCPTVTNQDQANLDGDPLGDVCDLDDDADKVFDVDEGPCGGDSLNAAKKPERLDTPGVDDDLDGMFNEGLPSPASDGFDCDGDGWKGNQENLIFAAGTTANDQDPCGNNGWAADLTGTNNTLNIADIASFLTPARSNDGHGTFNKFGHPLDDTPPVGIDAVMARWNLSLPPHDPATQINIADLNALIAGAAGSPARPPMFNGQIAFFTSGGMCPYLP